MNDNVMNFLTLATRNAHLKVICMVDDEVINTNFRNMRWSASFGKSYIEEIWQDDERLYFKSKDEDEIREKFISYQYDTCGQDISLFEMDALAEKFINEIEWEKAIILNIDLP